MTDAEARSRTIVLIGPPNAGKTSLYNLLTGSRFKTVNYPGATVEFSVGKLHHDSSTKAEIVDTPGIVSLVPRSLDEQVAIDTLLHLDRIGQARSTPDMLLSVVDATQPERHLPLVRQISRTGIPNVVALTMNDLARRRGRPLDPNRLSELLGVPVVEVDGRSGEGLAELVSAIEATPPPSERLEPSLPGNSSEETIHADFRWADGIVRLCVPSDAKMQAGLSAIDRVALHPVFGLVLFAVVMTGLFWSVFSAAAPFMDWIEAFFGWLGAFATAHLPASRPTSLLVDGVIAGCGTVAVFIPQIAILFLVLGVLEDSGYLARGAMLVDRVLSLVGLNGKSFVPLLSGNACAIPAALAARTIPGRKERMLTLLVIPLMSCSARLPVWGVLLAFLVPRDKPWLGGLALAAIYLLSIAFASIAALVGGKLLRIPPSEEGFQVELPHWRPPTFRTVVVSAWDRTVSYVQRAGLTILAVSILFWLFMSIPSPENSFAAMAGKLLEPLLAPMGVDWRVGIALIAAFAAREVFVSALAVAYSIQGAEDSTAGLVQAMRDATFDGTDQRVFTIASTAGLIVFFLIALQCLTTVAVMRRETSTRFALGQMAVFLGSAWLLASITTQGLRLLGVP